MVSLSACSRQLLQQQPGSKSFLVLFFKKELLPFLAYNTINDRDSLPACLTGG
jgi:hypothetical protein